MQTGGGPSQSSPEAVSSAAVRDQGGHKQGAKNLMSILKKEATLKSTPRPNFAQQPESPR